MARLLSAANADLDIRFKDERGKTVRLPMTFKGAELASRSKRGHGTRTSSSPAVLSRTRVASLRHEPHQQRIGHSDGPHRVRHAPEPRRPHSRAEASLAKGDFRAAREQARAVAELGERFDEPNLRALASSEKAARSSTKAVLRQAWRSWMKLCWPPSPTNWSPCGPQSYIATSPARYESERGQA